MTDYSRQLEIIATTTDETKLHNWMANAQRQNAEQIVDAARRRLVANAMPADGSDDPFEQEMWMAVVALEQANREATGKKTSPTRARQKIARTGVLQTIEGLASATAVSDGFKLLSDYGMLDLSAEAVVLRHPEHFSKKAATASKRKLTKAGYDPAAVPEYQDGGGE